jgi:hypothetical protein
MTQILSGRDSQLVLEAPAKVEQAESHPPRHFGQLEVSPIMLGLKDPDGLSHRRSQDYPLGLDGWNFQSTPALSSEALKDGQSQEKR